MWMEAFPLNMNGKVDRKALPKPEEILLLASYNAPLPGIEQQVALLWQQVLNVDRIGRDDNFFNVGGSSLKAIQVIAKIYRELDVQLTIAELFANPLLSQLSKLIENTKRETYRPIPKVEEQESYPLSNSQKRLWVLSQLDKNSIAYSIPAIYKIRGELDISALAETFRRLAERHESIRTVFIQRNGEPRQYILPAAQSGIELVIRDFRKIADITRHEYAQQIVQLPFDLEKGPLFRVELLQLTDEEYLLVCSIHHIISDDWSMQVMVRELIAIYNALSAQQEPDLAPLSIQYRDYAAWQQEQINAGHRQYWLSKFSGELPVLELPADRNRPPVQQHHGSYLEYQFSKEQSLAFQQLLQGQQATLFMGLTALVNVLLFRYSGQSDLITGTPVAGREHPDLENQIGYYLNTLALRNHISSEDSFVQVLTNIRQTTVEAFSNQSYPFDLLVEELGLGSDLSRSPLFDVVVILQNIQLNNDRQLEMKGVEVEPELSKLEISKSDLRFQFSFDEQSGVLFGNIEYNTDLYDRIRIERMSRHLGLLMDSINTTPDIAVNNIEYLSADEKSDKDWFNSILPTPAFPLLHTVIEEKVKQYKMLTAVEGYGMELTYEELNVYANKLAHALLLAGVKSVGVYATGGPLQVISLLAALKTGIVYIPMSPEQAKNRLGQMISETGMNIVITTSEHQSSLEKLLAEKDSDVSTILILDKTGFSISEYDGVGFKNLNTTSFSETNPGLTFSGDSPAYIFYTSGSTGNSKGIIGSHIALSHYIHWHKKEWAVEAGMRISQLAPMTFDASLKDILTALTSGATICMPDDTIKNNPARLAEWLQSNNINILQTVPSVFRLITAALLNTPIALPALRFVVLAGERLYGRDITMWEKANGTAARLSNLYGLTETTILKTCYHIPYGDWQPGEVIPVGFPVSNTLVAVINHNNLCGEGEVGEVYIKSPFISKGYLNTELNEQSLVPNPLTGDNNDLVWRTGDMGRYRSDNSLEILGRRDEQIKINGVRIELEQVRKAILQHEGITHTELLVHTGDDFRQELICYYTGNRYTAGQLRASLSDNLNPAMIPSYYVWMDSFPLNMNGKVDRKALPRPEEILLQANYTAPHAGIEQQTALLWQQVLGMDRIGRDDNFFNLGGSSLKAIQLIAKIYKDLDVQLTIAELFANPLLSQLATLIENAKRETYRPIPKVEEQESYPLSNSQKRLWVLSKLEEQSPAYNIPILYTLHGAVNTTALKEAFRLLIARHESIRTVFVLRDTEPRQRINEQSETELIIHDFRISPSQAKDYAEQLIHMPFDLEQGPLFRIELLRLADEEYRLVGSIHHIISDEWSMQIMFRELISLYNAISAGEQPQLPEMSVQYRDYAVWQQEQATGQHRQYWLSRFSGELPVLELPADRNRPAVQQHRGSQLRFQFSAEQSIAFQQLLQQEQATLFMGVTALVNVLLCRYSGQSDLIIGTPVAGREHPDLENQIGYYLNTLALRSEIHDEDSFIQVLEQVRHTTVEAFSHQSYPFDLLVEELSIGSDLSRSPLFDVVVILQNVQVNNDSQLEMNGIEVEQEPAALEISKSDLRFQFSADERNGILFGNIEYNTDLYDRERIERMSLHLRQLMQAINENPHITLYQVQDLITSEKQNSIKRALTFNSKIEED
jgi:tyrocidine synthetase-3